MFRAAPLRFSSILCGCILSQAVPGVLVQTLATEPTTAVAGTPAVNQPATIFAGSGKPAIREQPYSSSQPDSDREQLSLGNPFGVEIQANHWWVTTIDDHCIYAGKLHDRRLVRIAGTGVSGYSGDGGPATQATFNWPHEVRVDTDGNLFIADTRNHVIRRIDSETGLIETLAGDGNPGFKGDHDRGDRVRFRQPHSVVLDGRDGVLVADTGNHRIRRIDLKTGIVETISGTGEKKLPVHGSKASGSALFGPRSLAVDPQFIWIALREGNSIWRIVRQTNTLQHIAGTGKKGYSGDGGSPLQATFNGPKGLVIDDEQRILVVDTENHAIRRIDLKANKIETVMGGKHSKQTISLKRPHGIAFTPKIGFLVGDSEFHRVIAGR
ncbi:MAG: hypothetical protein VYA84_15755 [Planctomycetota bacterium]|nr:hypothetical protein [Planctomycetota bacterium]